MKKVTISLFILILISVASALSQYGNFQMDNGVIRGHYGHLINNEESVILKPPVPGIAKKLFIHFSGTVAKKDTIWVVGDPAEGAMPPSLWCQYINTYGAYIVDYKGVAGWYEIDLSGIMPQTNFGGLPIGGLNAVVIQHTQKPGGPYFTLDKQTQTGTNANSFINDVYKPNPNFYNIAGTMVSLTEGRFMVRLEMDYSFKDNQGAPVKTPPAPTLPDVTTERGLVSSGGQPIVYEMASVADFDNDGYDDIAISNNYFRNKGNGTFENITSTVLINNNGTVWADVDNDGFMDFYAARGGAGDRIYFGKADGTYSESTDNTFAIDAPTISPLFLDYDSDGLLDLFVAKGRKEANGQEQYFQDRLYKNMGNRIFKDVTVEAGIAAGEPAPFYDAWGATVCDYNNDGKPDIFVATYRLAPDLLYRNNGNGTFTDVGAATGARGAQTYSTSYFGHGMGADFGMISNNKTPDFVVGNLSHPDQRALSSNPSLVMVSDGNGTKFTDKTRQAMLGFFEMNAGIVLADLNNDGLPDAAHAQYAYYKKGAGKDKFSRIYLNEKGTGASDFAFRDITWESGVRIHGAWVPLRGDFDNNGGMDLLIASSNENAKLFDNKLTRGNWITVKLRGNGTTVNRDGFGSSVTVKTSSGKDITALLPGTILNGRAGQSSSDLHFGLGDEMEVQSVKIKFQDGHIVDAGNLAVNRKYIINYDGTITPMKISKPTLISPLNGEKVPILERVKFSWQKVGGAVKYIFQFSQEEDFSIPFDIPVTNNNLELELQGPAKLYWKVAAIDEDNIQSDWSDVWMADFGNVVVELLNPANNATNVPVSPEFRWSSMVGKKGVNFQLAEDINFSANLFDYEHQGDEMLTNLNLDNPLKNNTKYYWRVRVADTLDMSGNTDWSDWSETFSFTTTSGTSVNESQQVRFGFVGIYPNPASNNTTIEFELPYFANLALSIFDIHGNKVADICDGYFEPGVHSIGFDVSKLTSGSYMLRMTDGINFRSESLNIIR